MGNLPGSKTITQVIIMILSTVAFCLLCNDLQAQQSSATENKTATSSNSASQDNTRLMNDIKELMVKVNAKFGEQSNINRKKYTDALQNITQSITTANMFNAEGRSKIKSAVTNLNEVIDERSQILKQRNEFIDVEIKSLDIKSKRFWKGFNESRTKSLDLVRGIQNQEKALEESIKNMLAYLEQTPDLSASNMKSDSDFMALYKKVDNNFSQLLEKLKGAQTRSK